MAKFSKSIKILKSGTTYTVPVYSTSAEAGSTFTGAIIIDNTQGYYPLCGTSDSRATPGRCLHSNGTTYALSSTSTPVYSTKHITSGSGTFTVPAAVTKLRVTCVGGGCSGYASYYTTSGTRENANNTYHTASHYAGGTTTFGSVSAAGASSRTAGYNAGKSTSSNKVTIAGGAATPITNYAGTTVTSAGAGGNGRVETNFGANGHSASGGASGYRTQTTINVTPGQTISYSVGAGGAYHTKDSSIAYAGSAGAIYIEYGQGIQS